MSTIRTDHEQAMDLAEQAILASRNGDDDRSDRLRRRAYVLERRSALAAVDAKCPEPTRSVLLRSAATLAFQCGEGPDAEKLIALALNGTPPQEIANELRELLDQVHCVETVLPRNPLP